MVSLDDPAPSISLPPKKVQISDLGTGTQLSCAQTLQTADWETNIQSEVGTSGNPLQCHIILAGL